MQEVYVIWEKVMQFLLRDQCHLLLSWGQHAKTRSGHEIWVKLNSHFLTRSRWLSFLRTCLSFWPSGCTFCQAVCHVSTVFVPTPRLGKHLQERFTPSTAPQLRASLRHVYLLSFSTLPFKFIFILGSFKFNVFLKVRSFFTKVSFPGRSLHLLPLRRVALSCGAVDGVFGY